MRFWGDYDTICLCGQDEKQQSERRKEMKSRGNIMKNLSMLTQLGLSFITPLLLCLAGCWWLTAHAGLGEWVYLPGLFFGMGGSGMVAYKFYLSVMSRENKGEKKKKVSFNRHL